LPAYDDDLITHVDLPISGGHIHQGLTHADLPDL
jgi:hypothetical protein